MDYKDILITECKPGDLLAADVFADNGVVLAVKDVFLNEYIIEHLKSFGILKVPILDKVKNETKQLIRQNYKKSVERLKSAVMDLAAGKGLNYKDVSETSDLVYLSINEKDTIVQCLQEVKCDDDSTYTHSVNTAFYAMLLCKWMGLSFHQTKLAIEAGLLHDIGKVKIPKEILNKRGKLTQEEFEMVKQHTVLGFNLIKNAADIRPEVKLAILMHHERLDQSGYPLQLPSAEISFLAKIISIADVYDAMTSERMYKKRATPFETFKMLETAGVSVFDYKVLKVFLNNLPSCYMGSKVLLRNGIIGEVVYTSPQDTSNPIIKMGEKYVQMSENTGYEIVEML